jgi:predicted dehydrogenase
VNIPRTFAVVGTGWRAGMFVKVARAVPDRFGVLGVLARSSSSARRVMDAWKLPAYSSMEDLLEAAHPDFVVVSVPWAASVGAILSLSAAGVPVLAETPPAPDLEGLKEVTELVRQGARIQVTEQYPHQPLHAARLALTDKGAIGTVYSAYLSVAHGYHAFALMRRHLGLRGEPATVRATVHSLPVASGASRYGPPRAPGQLISERTVGIVDFGDRIGTYDFADTQYWSYVHRHHVVLRGSDGELADEMLHRVHSLDETVSTALRREHAGSGGDMSGHYLRGISGVDGWIWRNPFPGCRMFDDEIAVATVLELMGRHVDGGPPFYGVADAAQDHYLYLALQQAAKTGTSVRTNRQPWDDLLDTVVPDPFVARPEPTNAKGEG